MYKILALLTMLGCATLQYGVPVVPMYFANPMQAGMTKCDLDGNPVILIDQRNLENPRMKYVIRHEMVHVRQMQRNGGCVKTQEKYDNDQNFALRSEIEAYCVDFNAVLADNPDMNREIALSNIALVLANMYPVGKTPEEIRKMLRC